MKSLITIATFMLALTAHAESKIKGTLLCWKDGEPNALLNTYGTSNFNNKVDKYGRNSFIVHIGKDDSSAYVNQKETKSKVEIEWSISECEDMQFLVYPTAELKAVLSKEVKVVVGSFRTSSPDAEEESDIACVKLNRPVDQPELL